MDFFVKKVQSKMAPCQALVIHSNFKENCVTINYVSYAWVQSQHTHCFTHWTIEWKLILQHFLCILFQLSCSKTYFRSSDQLDIWHACTSIQIMNVYECNGKNIFMRWKIECSIQRSVSWVEWNIQSFTEWKYSFHCTNEKTFIICFI